MLARGTAHLHKRMKAKASSTVTYQRGDDTATVKAIIGRFNFKIEDTMGFSSHERSRDYLVEASDLAAFGEPEAGDLVQENDGTTVRTYEVMAPGGEQPWRWSDEFRGFYRIHTKWLKSEAAP